RSRRRTCTRSPRRTRRAQPWRRPSRSRRWGGPSCSAQDSRAAPRFATSEDDAHELAGLDVDLLRRRDDLFDALARFAVAAPGVADQLDAMPARHRELRLLVGRADAQRERLARAVEPRGTHAEVVRAATVLQRADRDAPWPRHAQHGVRVRAVLLLAEPRAA